MKGGKQYVGGSVDLTPAQSKSSGGFAFEKSITKVENPLPIKEYDTLKISYYENVAFIQVEVIQGNKKSLGKMKIYLK